jgi:hypothetical protein
MDTDMTPEKLIETVKALEVSNRSLSDNVETLKTTITALNESQAQAAMRAEEPTGNVDLARFQGREKDVQNHRARYLVTDAGAVRMRTHVSDGVQRPGLLDSVAESEFQAEFQRRVRRRNLTRIALERSGKAKSDVETPQLDYEIATLMRSAPRELAALRDLGERIWAGSANIGIDVIPETLIPGLARAIELTPSVSSLFQTQMCPANGRRAYTSKRARPYLHNVPTTDDPDNDPLSPLNSDSAFIKPIDLAVGVQMHRNIEEDGVISSLGKIEEDLRWAMVYGEADCIINGHKGTKAQHPDAIATWGGRSLDAVDTDFDHRLGWEGLRHLAIAKGKASDYSAVTGVDMVSGLMADVGPESIGQTVILMNYEFFLGVAIKWAAFQTWDKVGAAAAILTGMFGTNPGPLPGQVGFIYGVPVCLVSCLTADLNASGLYDGTTVDRTGMLIVNRARYTRWIRSQSAVETDDNIRNNTRTVVARRRLTFEEEIPGLTSEKNVAYAFNLPTS